MKCVKFIFFYKQSGLINRKQMLFLQDNAKLYTDNETE